MKVIDLLNKIANGEEVPKEIKTEEDIYEYVDIAYDYKKKCVSLNYWFFQQFVFGGNGNCLNYEVEIIEEPKGKEGFVTNGHRFVSNENGVSIFPVEEDKEIEEIKFDEIDEMTDYDIYSYPECSDDSKENFKNKINELIRNQKKIINELKKGK